MGAIIGYMFVRVDGLGGFMKLFTTALGSACTLCMSELDP